MKNITLSAVFILAAICSFSQPGNDACANATWITTDSTCVTGTSRLTGQTLQGATNQAYTIASSCYGANIRDVWYRFVAKTKYPTITISNQHANWGGISNVKIQLLAGTCGAASFTQIACADGPSLTPSLTSPLTEGTTYYIRVHKNQPAAISNTHTFTICITDPLTKGGRMREVFTRTVLAGGSGNFNYPWEVTYGSDNSLWITEAKGYKVYKVNPSTGVKTTVLDISQGSSFTPSSFRCQFNNGSGAQGGLAGLALHPKFLDPVAPQNYVYISYIHTRNSSTVFVNRLVRFTYNTGTGLLESPVSLCDTLPGSSDHNSQRMIIAPVNGVDYLFYASGDMGAGQFGNHMRTLKAQFINSYEGKILRFNLASDGDAGTLDRWIPNDNPYNGTLGVQSAVWATGMRNNQGFAYDSTTNTLYGSSHGPFSDDEINVIERDKNYGHPFIVGYSWDNNANSTTAGAAPNMSPAHPSSCPMISNETTAAAAIPNYKDPLFSAYPSSVAYPTLSGLWNTTNGGNGLWPSEGWSGLDVYTNKVIPGWKQSLIAAGLKWGRLIRVKLDAAGTGVVPTGGGDTITYFQSTNRYRDLAFAPNGRDIYVIMDNNSATSGPGTENPVTPACPGCLVKYSFLGYASAAGKSTIPDYIPVAQGMANQCNTGTTVTIDGSNNHLWVPITGPDGNILAEIFANGNNLGTVTSSFYTNQGAIRNKNGRKYLDRNITITTQNAPAGDVKIRLYITKAEYDALSASPGSGISTPANLKLYKNNDVCGAAMNLNPSLVTMDFNTEAFGSDGYVLQGTVNGFSTFYFGSESIITLPVELIAFKAALQPNNSVLLQWVTDNESATSRFTIERSADGISFSPIGDVDAVGNTNSRTNYSFTDNQAANRGLILYYRLRIYDNDGSYKYSQIIPVTFADIAGKVSVIPNPVQHTTTVAITAVTDGKIQLRVVDNMGRTVLSTSAGVRKGGGNTITLDMSRWAAGTYYMVVTGAGVDQQIKLQKL